jgi:nitrogen fixation NifU-like protein
MADQTEQTGFDSLVAELQKEIDEQERALYSARVIEEARNPKNVGRLSEPDAQAVVRGWCGDTMEIYLRLNSESIQQATFMTDGCGPSVACGSMLTQLIQGMSLEEANEVRLAGLLKALDGLPEESAHCAELAVNTLQEAIANQTH